MESLDDAEPLLRRFCPTNPTHVVVDEGDGSAVLNWAALSWDSDGVSVYREKVLENLGLDRMAILESRYTSLASTTKRMVEEFEHEVEGAAASRPFSAQESPRRDPPPKATDLAHASIVILANHGLSRKQLGKAQRRLARRAFSVELLA